MAVAMPYANPIPSPEEGVYEPAILLLGCRRTSPSSPPPLKGRGWGVGAAVAFGTQLAPLAVAATLLPDHRG